MSNQQQDFSFVVRGCLTPAHRSVIFADNGVNRVYLSKSLTTRCNVRELKSAAKLITNGSQLHCAVQEKKDNSGSYIIVSFNGQT